MGFSIRSATLSLLPLLASPALAAWRLQMYISPNMTGPNVRVPDNQEYLWGPWTCTQLGPPNDDGDPEAVPEGGEDNRDSDMEMLVDDDERWYQSAVMTHIQGKANDGCFASFYLDIEDCNNQANLVGMVAPNGPGGRMSFSPESPVRFQVYRVDCRSYSPLDKWDDDDTNQLKHEEEEKEFRKKMAGGRCFRGWRRPV